MKRSFGQNEGDKTHKIFQKTKKSAISPFSFTKKRPRSGYTGYEVSYFIKTGTFSELVHEYRHLETELRKRMNLNILTHIVKVFEIGLLSETFLQKTLAKIPDPFSVTNM